MLRILGAAVVTLTLAAPTTAQELPAVTDEQLAAAKAGVEELGLSEASYKDLWCGGAFILMNSILDAQGNAEDAAEALQLGIVLMNRVEATLAPKNLTSAQLNAAGSNGTIIALAQMGTKTEDFTEQECRAAAN